MRLLLTTLIFICTLSSAFASEGYIGEDLGLDLYTRIDQGTLKLQQKMVEQALRWSAAAVNKAVGMACRDSAKKTVDYCFQENLDFTITEMETLQGGNIIPIMKHLKSGYNNTMSTDTLAALRTTLLARYDKIRQEVGDRQKNLQNVGSIGLFTDGDIKNSGYDLMYDLVQIHKVIFASDIPYNGVASPASAGLANLLGDWYTPSGIPPDTTTSPNGINPNGTTPANPNGTNANGTTTNPFGTNSTNNCASGSGSGSIPTDLLTDTSLVTDIQTQTTNGTNNNSTSDAIGDNGSLPEWNTFKGKLGAGSGRGGDNFQCSGDQFICIIVSFVMYSQNLLGGGQENTIEGILDKNMKITNKISPTSLAQSKMTNNFFQCDICEWLDLPSMFHIGVVVTKLPPPILNLSSKTTPEKDRNEEFKEILSNSFTSVGLQLSKQNAVSDDLSDLAVSTLAGLKTDDTVKKFSGKSPIQPDYSVVKSMQLKKTYFDTFSDDLLELSLFTEMFASTLEKFTSIIDGLNAIP